MKYALIGCGRIAPSHINAAKVNGLEIVALCDIDSEKAEKFARDNQLENVRIYTSYKELLGKERLDLVAIATVSGTHGEIARYCAEQGVNFMVEKPLAMSMAEADAIIDAVNTSGVVASVCHQNRFNVAVQELRKAVENNRFSKLSHGSVHIRWKRNENYYRQDEWRGKWATDGGTLMNQCIHGIDLLRWMFGDEVDSVYGSARNQQHPYIEGEDVGVAVVNFKNGAVATIEGTVNSYQDLEETLCVFGEDGMVRIGGMHTNVIDVWSFKDEESADKDRRTIEETAGNIYGNGHISLYLDVIDSIKNKRTPYVDLTAGKNALELVLAIYKSQKTGEKVNLPLKDFSSLDMADADIS